MLTAAQSASLAVRVDLSVPCFVRLLQLSQPRARRVSGAPQAMQHGCKVCRGGALGSLAAVAVPRKCTEAVAPPVALA